ncbi:MAG: ATP-binding cassette domain-containing protein [Ignavibacteria bacterium]|nr:ATP-binding cassette domain-containing protein [Ignavibacteria bacterium]
MLEISHVTKKYGAFAANNDVSINVGAGKIFGLLGPNGAGKTTLIRMITNIIQPDSGTITLDGSEVSATAQESMGYLPEERGLYKKLSVIDQLVYFGRLKGLTSRDARTRSLWWLDRLDASSWQTKKVQELSKGMQQKVQFISTILHEPKLMILDEPFSGLDPVNADLLIQVVKEMQQRGATIILSTHQMDQVEKLCDDIALINKGQVVLNGSVRSIKTAQRADSIIIEYDGESSSPTLPMGVQLLRESEGRIELKLTDVTIATNDVISWAISHFAVIKFEVSQPSLHDIFVRTVTRQTVQEN